MAAPSAVVNFIQALHTGIVVSPGVDSELCCFGAFAPPPQYRRMYIPVSHKKQKKKNEKNPNFQDVHHEETALHCSFSDILIQCMMQSNSSTELVCTGQQY